jgi:hypothetical protein
MQVQQVFSNNMLNRLNKIQIHCWGGLGSQLNAWATAEALREKFKNKSIEIILHTGGVTKRTSEINFLSEKFDIKITDDFKNKFNSNLGELSYRTFINKFLKIFFNKLGLILNDETDLILNRVQIWTLSLRGHYSNEIISEQVISTMFIEIEKHLNYRINPFSESINNLGVHYRLGDLVELEEKSFVNPKLLAEYILKFIECNTIDKICVYSDSSKLSRISLEKYLSSSTTYVNKPIWNTLIDLCNHKYFIGTNSKISIWVSLFRKVRNSDANVSLPSSMESHLKQIYPKMLNSSNTIFY